MRRWVGRKEENPEEDEDDDATILICLSNNILAHTSWIIKFCFWGCEGSWKGEWRCYERGAPRIDAVASSAGDQRCR